MRESLGKYVVIDSKICHGQPTFKGTRIFVKDVLDQVAEGKAWKGIERDWHGDFTGAAIGEAIRLANQALLDQLIETSAKPA